VLCSTRRLLLQEIYGPTSKSFGVGILKLEVNTLLDLERCPKNYNERKIVSHINSSGLSIPLFLLCPQFRES
jgi:hypothetical protein